MMLRNLWKRKNLGIKSKEYVTDLIDPHDVLMITLTPNLKN